MKLALEKPDYDKNNTIRLHVVDDDGKHFSQGNLVFFHPDGTFERAHMVNPAFGFDLDEKGRIKLEDE